MSPSRRQSWPTKDGVVTDPVEIAAVELSCVDSCPELQDMGYDTRARIRLASRARRHVARTGHDTFITATTVTRFRADQ